MIGVECAEVVYLQIYRGRTPFIQDGADQSISNVVTVATVLVGNPNATKFLHWSESKQVRPWPIGEDPTSESKRHGQL